MMPAYIIHGRVEEKHESGRCFEIKQEKQGQNNQASLNDSGFMFVNAAILLL
ncbi:hypothetical protein Bca101_029794 [Brassica carinata]